MKKQNRTRLCREYIY